MCKRVRRHVLIVLIIVSQLLVGCSTIQGDTDNKVYSYKSYDYMNFSYLHDTDMVYIREGFHGIGFGVFLDGKSIPDHFDGRLELECSNFVLEASIENITPTDEHFILKVFINYEEVLFRPLGEVEYTKGFTFFLPSGKKVEIPFVLDLDFPEENYTYKLTAGIFIAPDINAKEFDMPIQIHGASLNFDLIMGEGGYIARDMTYNMNPLARRENVYFIDFRVNTQAGDLQAMEYSAVPELLLQGRAGEAIELSYFVNPSMQQWDELESYLIFAMLNFEQIKLSGESYLFVHVEEHEFNQLVEHGKFFIELPSVPGFYDFVAIMIPNPTNHNSLTNFFLLQIADRFTIEVVE